MKEIEVTSKKLACVIAQILDDKKAQNIQILNISNISTISDFFVIVSGQTQSQIKGFTNSVRVEIKKHFQRLPLNEENDQRNKWNLLDYGDVIVHIMQENERENYKIEKFWNNALKIKEDEWRKEAKGYSIFSGTNSVK